MLLIKDDTSFIDFDRNNCFCTTYLSGGTLTSGSTVLSANTIYTQLIITNKSTNQTLTYYDTIENVGGPRFFRLERDFTDLERGSYTYELKIMSFVDLVYITYEVGLLMREIKNIEETYTYTDTDENFIYVYKR